MPDRAFRRLLLHLPSCICLPVVLCFLKTAYLGPRKYLSQAIIRILTILCVTQYYMCDGRRWPLDRETTLKNLVLELRRGTLTLCVLSQLKQPQYGYSLLQLLSERGMEIDQNTLYPLLRRLEQQGLLDSDWSVEQSRPRRYYVLSSLGHEALDHIAGQWREMVQVMESLLRDEEEERNGLDREIR